MSDIPPSAVAAAEALAKVLAWGRADAERAVFLSDYAKSVYTRQLASYAAQEVEAVKAQKDGAYRERDALVAALSKVFPSSLERHPEDDEEWEDDWRWIVFVDLPAGQATWHIHDSELPAFAHLPRGTGAKWDGHTTEEKYRRLSEIPAARLRPTPEGSE